MSIEQRETFSSRPYFQTLCKNCTPRRSERSADSATPMLHERSTTFKLYLADLLARVDMCKRSVLKIISEFIVENCMDDVWANSHNGYSTIEETLMWIYRDVFNRTTYLTDLSYSFSKMDDHRCDISGNGPYSFHKRLKELQAELCELLSQLDAIIQKRPHHIRHPLKDAKHAVGSQRVPLADTCGARQLNACIVLYSVKHMVTVVESALKESNSDSMS